MSEQLTAASFDEALQFYTDKFGPIPERISNLSPYFFGADDAPAGYHARSDVGERSTLDGTPLSTMWKDFQARLALFNRTHDTFVQLTSFPVNVTTDRVAIPRRAKMEEATEFGQPALIRTERIARGYFLKHFDLGFGFTLEFLDDATDAEINAIRILAEDAWGRTRRETVLKLIFERANFTDPKEGIAVKKLYNGAGETPPEYEGFTHTSSHDHYLFSAGVALAETDLDAMEDHLLHHGYGDNSPQGAGGTLQLHLPRALVKKARAFTSFIPAVTSQIATILPISGIIVGQRSDGAGIPIEGTLNRWAIIENNAIPAGYLLGLVSGGLFNVQNPVGFREHKNPSARGLRLNQGRNDYPLTDSFYDGYAGGGVRHRGAAVVSFEDTGAAAAWVDPTI